MIRIFVDNEGVARPELDGDEKKCANDLGNRLVVLELGALTDLQRREFFKAIMEGYKKDGTIKM